MARKTAGRNQDLYVDARYEKVRHTGQVWDAAVLMATCITLQGVGQVLRVSVSLSEHESHWKAFLKRLKERSMHEVQLVISDDHEGLGTPRRVVLDISPSAKCWDLRAQASQESGWLCKYQVIVKFS